MLVDAVSERSLTEVTGLPVASQVRLMHRSRRISPKSQANILSAVGTAIPEAFEARNQGTVGLATLNAAQSYTWAISESAPHGPEWSHARDRLLLDKIHYLTLWHFLSAATGRGSLPRPRAGSCLLRGTYA